MCSAMASAMTPPMTALERRRNSAKRRHEELSQQVSTASDGKLIILLESLRAADVGELLEQMAPADRTRVVELLDVRRAARTLKRARAPVAAEVLELMERSRAADILEWMAVDDRASLLENLAPSVQEELLAEMEQRAAREARDSLAWPPHSAGRLIQTSVARVALESTVASALESVRGQPQPERASDVYVVDAAGVLHGVINFRDLVYAPASETVRGIMNRDAVTVRPEEDQERVAHLIAKYDLTALPVVDDRGRLLGVITIDDVLDVLDAEHGEDVLNLGAVDATIADQPYFGLRITQLVKSRAGWLMLLFVAETATGAVLRHFEDELARVVALSFFIPLLIGTGGNAGSQTVSTVIRGLSVGDIRTHDWFRVVRREASVGIMLGLILGLTAFLRAALWGMSTRMGCAVGVSILAICVWSNTVGALVPMLAQRLKVDPTVVSAPLITTLVDGTGLFIYLKVAGLVLGL